MASIDAAAPTDLDTYDAVVVGAGFAGLYALHRLRERGLRVLGFEAGDEVGGTWYFNRYPGARCDIPSLYYSYSWSPELRAEWQWSEKYAQQEEIRRYINFAADRLDLRGLIRFGTRIDGATFDEASELWTVRPKKGSPVAARYVVMATGALSKPSVPAFPGLGTFAGPVYRTSAWPEEDVDFSGLRVGVVGTGSSAVQAIPLIAEHAAQLTVFQRTANYSVPARNRPLQQSDLDSFEASYQAYLDAIDGPTFGRVTSAAYGAPTPTAEQRQNRFEELWQQGGAGFIGAFPNLLVDAELNEHACEFIRGKIRQTVHDPGTAEMLCPSGFPLGVKRICVDTDYFETYNRPNVSLVSLRKEPLQEIRPTGIRTSAGDYEFDVLVLATGFDAITGALMSMDIRGREGASLAEAWADGAHSYLGIAVAGFPNLFTINGPGSSSAVGNVIANGEHHVEWIMALLAHMDQHALTTVEPDPTAEMEWMAQLWSIAENTLFPKADSWYLGANIPGKPRVFLPYIGEGYRYKCAQVAASDYKGFVLS